MSSPAPSCRSCESRHVADPERGLRHGADDLLGLPFAAQSDQRLALGLRPGVQIPTASSPLLGSSVWGGGATGVLVYMNGPWVAGVLVNNVWSLGGSYGLYGNALQQFPDPALRQLQFRWRLVRHHLADCHRQLGNAGDQMDAFRLAAAQAGLSSCSTSCRSISCFGAYYNTVKPEFGPNWQLRTQVTFIF